MKKLKILIIFFFVLLIVFLIYKKLKDDRINYLVIGDYLAVGTNAYGDVNYGYSDYLKNYLIDNNKLKSYNNLFINSNYSLKELTNDIYNNKIIKFNNKDYSIKKLLRNSNLLTISIGNNELNEILINSNDIYNDIDNLLKDINSFLNQVRNYAKNKIIFLGYYQYNNTSLEYIKYINNKLNQLLIDYDISYFDTDKVISSNSDYLPNHSSNKPGNKGYIEIGNKIINQVNDIFK